MNCKQKWVCWIALGLFCFSLLSVPVAPENWRENQHIPFFSVTAYQKMRMDILSIEWIGIAAIAGVLCFLLKSGIQKVQPSIEKVKKRSGFWKFIEFLFAVTIIAALVAAGIRFKIMRDEEQIRIKKDQYETSCISKAEAFVTDVKLECDEKDPLKKNYILTGKVQNLSTKYKLIGLCIRVSIIDVLPTGNVLPNGANEVVASRDIYVIDGFHSGSGYNDKVPPAQTYSFRNCVEFGDLPVPYGKMSWTSQVVEIRGESDDQITVDKSLQTALPVPQKTNPFAKFFEPPTAKSKATPASTNVGLFDDILSQEGMSKSKPPQHNNR